MREAGIDISNQHSKSVKEFLGRLSFGHVIAVCKKAEEQCPVIFPSALHILSWPFDDPAAFVGTEEEKLGEFRRMVSDAAKHNDSGPILTTRETEVLRRVAKGMAYREIADELYVSHRTVQNHVQNTLGKLQLHNRVELVRYAIAQGLDTPTAPGD